MTMNLEPTEVYDTYWKFAAERQAVYFRRLFDSMGPWTDDPIIAQHRFTNAYRASDRVSQYLIRHVQYGAGDDDPVRSQNSDEMFFRTILFKMFNKIETWQELEWKLGPLKWSNGNLQEVAEELDRMVVGGRSIYSGAYMIPNPPMGGDKKHWNHLTLLDQIMRARVWQHVEQNAVFYFGLRSVYDELAKIPSFGPFLAFQYAIDLNYSDMLICKESEFVVAGPGAIDGISKCFANAKEFKPDEIIAEMADRQDREFERLGLTFGGLFGRKLQLIDCQNLFCEISKYSRVSHPDVGGSAGRKRIKQKYRPASKLMELPFFPPKWGLNERIEACLG